MCNVLCKLPRDQRLPLGLTFGEICQPYRPISRFVKPIIRLAYIINIIQILMFYKA